MEEGKRQGYLHTRINNSCSAPFTDIRPTVHLASSRRYGNALLGVRR